MEYITSSAVPLVIKTDIKLAKSNLTCQDCHKSFATEYELYLHTFVCDMLQEAPIVVSPNLVESQCIKTDLGKNDLSYYATKILKSTCWDILVILKLQKSWLIYLVSYTYFQAQFW